MICTFDLPQRPVVVEIGSYLGRWAAEMASRYQAELYLFEPIAEFCTRLRERFANYEGNATVYPWALLDHDCEMELTVDGESSSLFVGRGSRRRVQVRDVKAAFDELSLLEVDVLAINAEGSEYRLLARMLDVGITLRCRNILIQFHDIHPDSTTQVHRIRHQLDKSHAQKFKYDFLWENWQQR